MTTDYISKHPTIYVEIGSLCIELCTSGFMWFYVSWVVGAGCLVSATYCWFGCYIAGPHIEKEPTFARRTFPFAVLVMSCLCCQRTYSLLLF